ncbi:hypothetical protein PVAP13_5KG204800 [Panicum virgatum]|uniref:DUF7769 domain-containing protein n=1 Tax=Panicum virgatum TaxID=38727 RepID=A0A8T0SEU1_PANVG|nr:hypothetical protein PVAP13_5KG204800 [Panicum virgatum]
MAMTSHHLLEPTPWEIDMEHLLLTSTWQHTNQMCWMGSMHLQQQLTLIGFNAPAAAATNFDSNIDLEEEEADDDADVYAVDFHVIFAEEELQVSIANGDQADVFHAADETTSFDLNHAWEEEVLDGSSDMEHVGQGSQIQHANMAIRRKNLSDKERQAIYEALLLCSVNGKLKRRTTTIVANLFNVNRCYVQSIWMS